MTHGHFDMGCYESTFSEYAFGRGGGGHKKEYAVYAQENDDNYGRPLSASTPPAMLVFIHLYYPQIMPTLANELTVTCGTFKRLQISKEHFGVYTSSTLFT